MNRITALFDALKQERRAGLIGYLMAGDPTPELSLDVLTAACRAGLDLIEIGVPFSDPTADGPVIQAAGSRALCAGMTLEKVLALAGALRERVDTPMVLFSYLNPILSLGAGRLHAAARAAGVDGLLVVDLPPEEALSVTREWSGDPLPLIRLIAPTTPETRMRTLVGDAGGFLYVITRKGVTGAGTPDTDAIRDRMRCLRAMTPLPIALGFGIRTPLDVAALAPLADAVVVGSALVERVAPEAGPAAESPYRMAAAVRALRVPLDSAPPQ